MWLPCISSIDVQNWDFILENYLFEEYEVYFPNTFDNFWLKVYFIGYSIFYPYLFLELIYLEMFSAAIFSVVVSVFVMEVCFL